MSVSGTANWIVRAISLLIGLGFIAVMPAACADHTALPMPKKSVILFCLMTVASPLARQYYFMWLVLSDHRPGTPGSL